MRSPAIHIPAPCHESWAAMTPTGPGRHCAACQKTVVDFTQKTDSEILALLKQAAGGESCGRFRADQLARPLVPAAAPGHWRIWLGILVAAGGVLSIGRAAAQANAAFNPGPVPAASPTSGSAVDSPVAGVSPVAIAAGPAPVQGPLIVRGIVRDRPTGQGLPGVSVLVQGTTQGTSTNIDGEFTLTLADTTEAVLQMSFVGYTTTRLSVCGTAGETVAVQAQLTADVQGMLVSMAPPALWHPRELFGWARYWLGRPFRR